MSVIFDLFVCFRLMVNLTQPAVLCFGNNIPDDKTGQHYYLDLVTQLQSYKEVVYFNCREQIHHTLYSHSVLAPMFS